MNKPYIDQLRERQPGIPVTRLLVAANVLVFVAMLAHGAGLWHTNDAVQLAWGANFGPATKDGEWWRLGSAMFLHFGVLHLVMNMLALLDGGRLVERMYGSARFAIAYVAGGLSGNLVSLVMQGDQAVSGGASGAIFGIYGALLWHLWRSRASLHPGEFKWLFWGAAGYTVMAAGLGFVVPGIDNAAHIGGLLSGTLVGVVLAPPPGGRHAGWLAGGGYALAVAVLAMNIPEPRYRWSEERLASGEIREFLGEDARISARFGAILGGARQGASFEDLAGQIEAEVASRYAESFEELSGLHLDPAAPSARALAVLRDYAALRRDASQALVQGLRANDPARIREAIELAQQAPARVGKAGGVPPP